VNADQNYHTQLCFDLRPYDHMYLHITFAGTDEFSISLNQNNEQCNPSLSPYPETWDTVEASRYSISRYPLRDDIYIPISHFNIDLSRAVSVSFNGFYTDDIPLTLFRVEIVPDIPDDVSIPEKLPVLKIPRPHPLPTQDSPFSLQPDGPRPSTPSQSSTPDEPPNPERERTDVLNSNCKLLSQLVIAQVDAFWR
jgi:hypothetical protein